MSRQNVSTREALQVTLKKFLSSSKGVNDYVELLLVAGKNVKEMNWEEIEGIVREFKI